MRATISFEANVSKVNGIMRSLVLEETNTLQDALMSLEKATDDRIVEGISEALGHIYSVANQLEQYRGMVVSFEKARFDTILPRDADQPVAVNNMQEVRQVAQQMQSFDSFLGRINEETPDEESAPEEG